MSHGPKAPIEPVVTDLTYEDRDVNLKVIVLSVVVIFVIIIVAFVGMFAMLKDYQKDMQVAATKVNPMILEGKTFNTSGPMLQVDPVGELKAYNDREDTRLNQSGSYTTPTGEAKFHVPVSHAMTLVLDDLNGATPKAAAPAGEKSP